MSRPTAISPEEQEQIARRIGVLLLQAAPEDWQQITVEYRATGEYHDLLGEVASQDGSSQPWDPPDDLLGIFEHLREGMYQPDVGTWLSALYIVERPSSYRIDINFDSEPRWRRPLPRAAYVDELRRYPRDDKNIPDWMREKLDGSSGAPQQSSTSQAAESTPAAASESPASGAPASGAPSSGAGASVSGATGPGPLAPEMPPTYEPATSTAMVPPAMTSAAMSNGSASAATETQESAGFSEAPFAPAMSASRDADSGRNHAGLDAPEDSSTYAVNGTQAPSEDEDFRIARLFDGFDDQGRPVVTTRAPVPPEEAGALRNYLENAKVVLSSQDYAEDLLDLEHSPVVPTTWHTDGVWVWEGAVAYYLAQYGLPPEPELVEHVRQRRFTLSDPDEHTGNAAANAVLNQLDSEDAADDSAIDERSIASEDGADDRAVGSTVDSVGAFDGATEASARSDSTTASQTERDTEGADFETVLARLHDKFSEYDVDGNSYRIGSHSTGARCLVQEGPDWVVTPGPDEPGSADLRFERADQAAAYLLGSLLMSTPPRIEPSAPEAAVSPGAVASESDAAGTKASGLGTSESGTSESEASASSQSASTAASPDESAQHEVPAWERDMPALEDNTQDASEPDRDYPAIGGLPRRSPTTPAQAAEQSSGGHFLFTANQESPADSGQGPSGQPPAPESPLSQPAASQPAASQPFGQEPVAQQPGGPAGQDPRRDGPQQQVAHQQGSQQRAPQQQGHQQQGPQQQPTPQQPPQQPVASQQSGQQYPNQQHPGQQSVGQQQSPQRDDQNQNPGEQPTRYRALPSMDRPGPPPSPPSPPTGQPMGEPASHGPASNGQPQPGPNESPGQGPPPLPKRPPRGGQGSGPVPPGAGNPPQSGPNGHVQPGQVQPGANGAPPQPGPPPQGPVPGGRSPQSGGPGGQPAPGGQGPRPPQSNSGGNQPQAGQEQQIQPLRGEPPLTLYRDRHNIVLQPGTDVDRFGEPGGNVAYGARTPYSQRSLPPQWANRTYRAYRVQRPLQVLKGTAVPWFEQPGGGTAYVLPAAISDLIADGALIELSGNEAPPRPAMD